MFLLSFNDTLILWYQQSPTGVVCIPSKQEEEYYLLLNAMETEIGIVSNLLWKFFSKRMKLTVLVHKKYIPHQLDILIMTDIAKNNIFATFRGFFIILRNFL